MAYIGVTKPSVGDATKRSVIAGMIDNQEHFNAQILPSSRINLISNGSFEAGSPDPSNWDFTDYTGGSHAISTAQRANGAQSISFTSTSTANGGGYAESGEFVAVTGGRVYYCSAYYLASVANVSSQVEVDWYDNTQVYISSSTILSQTNTPTTFTQLENVATAPATARYCKVKITGGVPGSGTATGTIYFDAVTLKAQIAIIEIPSNGITADRIATNGVGQAEIAANSVGLSETILTQTESSNTVAASGTAVLLSGVVCVWSSGNLDLEILTNGAWRTSKVNLGSNGPATLYCDGTNYRVLNNDATTQTYYYKRRD